MAPRTTATVAPSAWGSARSYACFRRWFAAWWRGSRPTSVCDGNAHPISSRGHESDPNALVPLARRESGSKWAARPLIPGRSRRIASPGENQQEGRLGAGGRARGVRQAASGREAGRLRAQGFGVFGGLVGFGVFVGFGVGVGLVGAAEPATPRSPFAAPLRLPDTAPPRAPRPAIAIVATRASARAYSTMPWPVARGAFLGRHRRRLRPSFTCRMARIMAMPGRPATHPMVLVPRPAGARGRAPRCIRSTPRDTCHVRADRVSRWGDDL